MDVIQVMFHGFRVVYGNLIQCRENRKLYIYKALKCMDLSLKMVQVMG